MLEGLPDEDSLYTAVVLHTEILIHKKNPQVMPHCAGLLKGEMT